MALFNILFPGPSTEPGTHGCTTDICWMNDYKSETSKYIHPCNYLLRAFCEPEIGLYNGKTIIVTLILITITVKTITATVYWTFTMHKASCQALLIYFFNYPPKPHVADTSIIPIEQMKKDVEPLLWTLTLDHADSMWKNLWHLCSSMSIYMSLTHID